MPPLSDRPKREPAADLRQAASGMHEMFVALVDEGFTKLEALQLLGAMLAASINKAKDTE